MKLFENAKRKKLLEAKDVELPNSNLYLIGLDRDTNGNSVVKLFFPNQRAFSIQVYGETMKKSQNILRGVNKIGEISEKDLEVIEKEATDYIKKFGSAQQKKSLKTYGKLEEASSDDKSKKYQDFQKQINELYDTLQKKTSELFDKRDSEVRKMEMERMSLFQDWGKLGNMSPEREKIEKKYKELGDKVTSVSNEYNSKIGKIRDEYDPKIEALRKKQMELFK